MVLETKDAEDFSKARDLLASPGFAIKAMNLVGKPIETGFKLLPSSWKDTVGDATEAAIKKALQIALLTMDTSSASGESYEGLHQLAAMASGGIGGFFGLWGLPVELPITTTIMLRSIADIARSEGAALSSVDVQLACIEVFALGGNTKSDDAADEGYYMVRAALSEAMANAARHIAEKGVAEEGAPVVVRLIIELAKRFSVQVTEKLAAQAVPLIGAAAGMAINSIFIDHFQDMARGHFIILRLEKKYGPELIRDLFNAPDN